MAQKINSEWMTFTGKAVKPNSVAALAKACKDSQFNSDAIAFSHKIAESKSIIDRQVLYQALMYVSAQCAYNAVDRITHVNETKYLTYSQVLQAFISQDAEAFQGNLQDTAASHRYSMSHKWELLRDGYYHTRAATHGKRYSIDYSQINKILTDEVRLSPMERAERCANEYSRMMRERSNALGYDVV